MGPWSSADIASARSVPFGVVLRYLGAYTKRDHEYRSHRSTDSIRVYVSLNGREFRFVFTGEKWLNDLMPSTQQARGGGGSIDLVSYLTGCGFVQAVKVCLDAMKDPD
jgi:hypothetical protein